MTAGPLLLIVQLDSMGAAQALRSAGYREVTNSQLSWFKRHWNKDFKENTGYEILWRRYYVTSAPAAGSRLMRQRSMGGTVWLRVSAMVLQRVLAPIHQL